VVKSGNPPAFQPESIPIEVCVLYRMKRRSSRTRRKMRGGGLGKKYVFYHVFCNKSTLEVVRDQTTKIIFSGLYDAVDTIYCFLAGEEEFVGTVKSFIENLPSKFKIQKVGIGDKSQERFTIEQIDSLVTNEDVFLYMHSKGVSRSPGPITGFEPVYLWRTYMEYNLIRHHEACVKLLASHDIVGSIYKEKQIGPHFSGNFWWSTGSYFKRVASNHKINDFYPDAEKFIFKEAPRAYKFDGERIPNMECFYRNPYHLKQYVDDKENFPGLHHK